MEERGEGERGRREGKQRGEVKMEERGEGERGRREGYIGERKHTTHTQCL